MAHQYDVTLKAILQNAMPGLLRLLGLPGGPVEYLTVEFPVREKLLPDLVVRLADGRILHIELQARNDPEMEWRCLDYFRVISRRWKDTTIVQVVVYLGDGPMTMAARSSWSSLADVTSSACCATPVGTKAPLSSGEPDVSMGSRSKSEGACA